MQNPASTFNPTEARMTRALTILESKRITKNEKDGVFTVPSQSFSKVSYEVQNLGTDLWACTCPDFEQLPIGVSACKHVIACRILETTKQELKPQEPKPQVVAPDTIKCDKCQSINIMRYGFDGNRQIFKCKDCGHKFRESTLLKQVRFSPEFVTFTLDLYFSGLSLRKVARTVSDHFEIQVDYSTIYRWIEKYVPIISEYVNSLKPELSDTWHADELFVRVKGSQLQGRYAGLAFVWNVMDRETRFLLASKLSEGRDIAGSIKAFQTAINNANGQTPDRILTDAHKSYSVGINLAFEGKDKPEHVKNCGIKKKQNNNRIERMNGTLRERVKVQRGWKNYQTPLAEGQRIQYNFIKPHQALDGKTPAEASGIKGKDSWLELLKETVDRK